MLLLETNIYFAARLFDASSTTTTTTTTKAAAVCCCTPLQSLLFAVCCLLAVYFHAVTKMSQTPTHPLYNYLSITGITALLQPHQQQPVNRHTAPPPPPLLSDAASVVTSCAIKSASPLSLSQVLQWPTRMQCRPLECV